MNGDMHDLRGGVPILGSGGKVKAVPNPPTVFASAIGDDGMTEVMGIETPKGIMGIWARDQYLDADELIEEILKGVEKIVQPLREEIRVLRSKLKKDKNE